MFKSFRKLKKEDEIFKAAIEEASAAAERRVEEAMYRWDHPYTSEEDREETYCKAVAILNRLNEPNLTEKDVQEIYRLTIATLHKVDVNLLGP